MNAHEQRVWEQHRERQREQQRRWIAEEQRKLREKKFQEALKRWATREWL